MAINVPDEESLLQMLVYKCQKYGKEPQVIDERNTSKMCNGCGHLQPMPLHKRTYCCEACGMVMDRDSAVNILARYLTLVALTELSRYLAGLPPHTSTEKCGVLYNENDEVGVAGTPHFPIVQQLRLW